MRYDFFPDELPTDKLSLLVDIARGKAIDKREAALAALNVIGFAADKLLPPSTFGSTGDNIVALGMLSSSIRTPDADELEAAVAALHREQLTVSDAAKAGFEGKPVAFGGGVFLLTVVKFALPILLKILVS